jgi:hypothetical protein
MNPAVSPAMLFTNFGTHIFLVANIGVRMDMDFKMENTKRKSTKEINAKVKASYSYVSAENETTLTEAKSQFEENYNFKAIAYGGDTTGVALDTFEKAKATYQRWADSFSYTNNLSLVSGGTFEKKEDIYNKLTEMLPIWELIDTSAPGSAGQAAQKRKDDLLKAFNKMVAENRGIILGLQQECNISGVYMGAGETKRAAEKDVIGKGEGKAVTPVKVDLNKDVGKIYLYLGYSLTASDSEAPVTDMKAYSTTSSANPPNTKTFNSITYTLINGYDANKGAKGDYIWLYYTTNKNAGKPLQNIWVEDTSDETADDTTDEAGWVRVKWDNGKDADMNKGTGRTPIYVWIKHKTD